jgi:hypothetical protein
MEEEVEFVFDDEEQEAHLEPLHSHRYPHDMQDELSADSNDSPFFAEAQRPDGLSAEEIRRIPTMYWGHNHNRFNGGEKCGVCL